MTRINLDSRPGMLVSLTTAVATMLLLSACASAPQPDDSAVAPTNQVAGTGDPVQIEAANNSEEAIRAADRKEYRDCLRRVRRTGSRIARSECESSIFGSAYHSSNEQKTAEAGTVDDPG